MEWIPVLLLAFKLAVFGIGMFFAIKWHNDREKEEKAKAKASARRHEDDGGA